MTLRTCCMILVLGLVVLAVPGTLLAQRPWQRATTPQVGTAPALHTAANALIALEDSMATSIDVGLSWQMVAGIPAHQRGVTDFFGNVTICASQPAAGDSVEIWFTQGGSSWTYSEHLYVSTGAVVDLSAVGQVFYITMDDGTILARGRSINSLAVPVPSGERVLDMEMSATIMAALSTNGLYLSADAGQTWEMTPPPSENPVSLIDVDGGTLFAACGSEMYQFNSRGGTWENHTAEAPFPGPIVGHSCDALYLVALTRTTDGFLQMYRQERGSAQWDSVGYVLHIPDVQPTRNRMVVDGGWAVISVASDGLPDSNGVYRYDLYDNITSVRESHTQARIHLMRNALTVTHPWPADGGTATSGVTAAIYSLDGSQWWSGRIPCSECPVAVPAGIPVPAAVVVRAPDGSIVRSMQLP